MAFINNSKVKKITKVLSQGCEDWRVIMRRKMIAGNWKMNKTPTETRALINELKPRISTSKVDVVLCVPSISILPAVELTQGTGILIGAQNMYFKDKGAYTGEISSEMIKDAGAKYLIVGHSERREYFNETDDKVNMKITKAIRDGLIPILCCGETLSERESGKAIEKVRNQIVTALKGIALEDITKVIIAYEPIWAIGTGKVATAAQAEEVCKEIRNVVANAYSTESAEEIRILYGGSMNEKNAEELLCKEDIDGGLIGGASLTTAFADIVDIAGGM